MPVAGAGAAARALLRRAPLGAALRAGAGPPQGGRPGQHRQGRRARERSPPAAPAGALDPQRGPAKRRGAGPARLVLAGGPIHAGDARAEDRRRRRAARRLPGARRPRGLGRQRPRPRRSVRIPWGLGVLRGRAGQQGRAPGGPGEAPHGGAEAGVPSGTRGRGGMAGGGVGKAAEADDAAGLPRCGRSGGPGRALPAAVVGHAAVAAAGAPAPGPRRRPRHPAALQHQIAVAAAARPVCPMPLRRGARPLPRRDATKRRGAVGPSGGAAFQPLPVFVSPCCAPREGEAAPCRHAGAGRWPRCDGRVPQLAAHPPAA
mmetsp:Transcript_37982/g.119180  ORF Transcript_37982/g.119180 Transcript_37982/m.119180 type:complete len:317 (+) Transcript_37982:190-1140(+)